MFDNDDDDVVVWCLASEADVSKPPVTSSTSSSSSSSSTACVAVSQYSAKPHMYSITPAASTEPAALDMMQSAADGSQPYMQQIVQHVITGEPAGPAMATALYQPPPPTDAMTYRQVPQDTTAYHAPAPSTLVLQHETNAAPTHFVLPSPAPPSMPAAAAAFGPSLPQFVVGQPGAVRPIDMERFGAPPPPLPPPPPPGSVPYPAMPCVSGINTASGPVSYWMTLN